MCPVTVVLYPASIFGDITWLYPAPVLQDIACF